MFLRSVLHCSTRAKVRTFALYRSVTMLHSPFSMLQTCPIWHKVPKLLPYLLGYIFFFELFLCT
ncbi:hypothetical protein GAX96_09590 [Phocaeicola vulgatus]|uniref:Uncharacterized protein n=2 Tax=Phocaeicola vulgatus TaxID=821 RepID=A0A395UKG4_PHOVU|nr:hypothetical protein GAY14_12830 [Phocaeicola vulgatus]RJU60059.1 hypothetical protein DW710_04915 [Bacteroides sp. AM27-13]RJU77565.1 hypothetical protein DW693_03980 [Bacteroides sp. AM26-11]RJV12263.1 hypothetical protein DWZ41_15340 [Bacteroides sp. AF32-15BH]TWV65537.1 hypothetical protein FR997_02550 [Phocaeicola dorei]HAT99256.1 hypothetical protein [Bacteroides sp.]